MRKPDLNDLEILVKNLLELIFRVKKMEKLPDRY